VGWGWGRLEGGGEGMMTDRFRDDGMTKEKEMTHRSMPGGLSRISMLRWGHALRHVMHSTQFRLSVSWAGWE
jgi:hypothetical protein